MRFAVLAAVLALSLPAIADPAPLVAPTPVVAAQPAVAVPAMPASVTLTAEQLQALLAAQQAPKPTVSTEGLLGFSWAQIAGWAGALGAILFGFWKTAAGTRTKKTVEDGIAAAWWIIERNFSDLPGPAKASLALAELYKGLAGQGIPLDPKVGAQAQAAWAAMSAQAGLQVPPVAPVPPAALATAQAAAKVAVTPGSATDLADAAAR